MISKRVVASAGLSLFCAMTVAHAADSKKSDSPTASVSLDHGNLDNRNLDEGPKGRLRAVLESWFPTLGTEPSATGSSDELDTAGSPTAFGELLAPQAVLSEVQMKRSLPWQPPNFGNQSEALGWTPEAFALPLPMKERVAFWKDIYAKYTTSQGVMHDPVTLGVYAPIEFPNVRDEGGMGYAQNARLRNEIIDSKKAEITARLLSLQERVTQNLGPEGLEGEDLRYWKIFESQNDPLRFMSAVSRIRFQLGQKDRFLLGIYYSGRYLRQMETIFKEEGLPIELTRLPFVESSFNVNARSKVGASGIWQFMPRTARAYMKVNKEVDDRNDPLVATRAAARLLRGNYQMLGTWPLALTGYNHGPYGVKQVVEKMGTNDISEIVSKYSSRSFGFASQNFFACFLAALEVERDAKLLFQDPKWSPAVESGELKAPKLMSWTTLTKMFDGNEALTIELNPHLLSRARDSRPRIPQGTRLRVPLARLELAKQAFAGKLSPSKLMAQLKDVPMPKSFDSGGSILEAAQTVVQSRLLRTSATADVMLPWMTGAPAGQMTGPATGQGIGLNVERKEEKKLFTPRE